MSMSTCIFNLYIYRERHCNDLIELWLLWIWGIWFPYFCDFEVFSEMRTGVWSWSRCPVLNRCRGNFPSEFPPSILFLRLGIVSPTYPAMWPASASNLCYLHLTKQTHTFIHCSSGCLPRDKLGWDAFPCDILVYSCRLGKHLPVSCNWRLASPVCSYKNLFSRCIFLVLTLKCWVMSFSFRN